MDASSQEFQEEMGKLEARERHVEEFLDKAEGAFMRAEDSESAKLRLYEIAFYKIAYWQLLSQRDRLKGASGYEVETAQGDLLNLTQSLDAIQSSGDWTGLKKNYDELFMVTGEDLDYHEASRMGLPMDLSIDGVFIFKQTPTIRDDENGLARSEAWSALVERQLALVPDHGEPFVHPNLAELKSHVGA